MELCTIDARPILTMCFRGSGVCCETCRKKRDGNAHFNPEMNSQKSVNTKREKK